ncbi:unnamed protein product, partial [Mesorhabditis spiculigera]
MRIARPRSPESFKYVHSCDLNAFVQIMICDLSGVFRDPTDPTRKLRDLLVEATVYCEGEKVGFPVSTAYSPRPAAAREQLIHSFGQWLTLPVRYCDLSRDAYVHFTIWEHLTKEEDEFTTCGSASGFPNTLVAQATMHFFCERGVLKRDTIELRVHPGGTPDHRANWEEREEWVGHSLKSDEAAHLYQSCAVYKSMKERGTRHDEDAWLSRISFMQIERLKTGHQQALRDLFLVVKMSYIRHGDYCYDVVYYERSSTETRLCLSTVQTGVDLWRGGDAEIGLENLSEAKHTQMARFIGSTQNAKSLKPNREAKAKLEQLLQHPSSLPLTFEQRDLVWKFRYFLQRESRALTKFVRSVNWENAVEEQQALELLKDWRAIEAEDALELLSPSITHPAVRGYAVSRLIEATSHENIILFLPQLVQALKYEPQQDAVIHSSTYINSGLLAAATAEMDGGGMRQEHWDIPTEHLASVLIKLALTSMTMANFLYWHLKVEAEVTKNTENPEESAMYEQILKRLFDELQKASPLSAQSAQAIKLQQQWVENLQKVLSESKGAGGDIKYKEKILRTNLLKAKTLSDQEIRGLVLPLDPNYRIEGMLAESANIFNSKAMPMKLTLRVASQMALTSRSPQPEEYTFIFKQGDDLRQDQLVIQMIRLMDRLMKRDQLDLRLTPYSVLATGLTEGFVQFVKATPLRDIFTQYQTIPAYLQAKRPSRDHPLKIETEVVENYVRSLAGYSIVCYILGIGDRHNDNLLLCENGKLFHVDFGYMLGRDPKPLPPPMKLSSEMMLLISSDQKWYDEFISYCDSAFKILRRNANVILNLFSLMLDAGIPDIAIEKDKAVFKIETRMQLGLNEEQASQFMMKLIESSQQAKMPVLVDFIHDFKLRFF